MRKTAELGSARREEGREGAGDGDDDATSKDGAKYAAGQQPSCPSASVPPSVPPSVIAQR